MRMAFKLVIVLVCAYLLGSGVLLLRGMSEDVFEADVAVVLGNEVRADGTCAPRTAARLDRAILLYTHGYCTKIIVSGARGGSGYNEAVAMRDYLLACGIPAHAVVVDDSGVNTRKTALFTTDYMTRNGYSKVIAVSQYFHLPRTRLALEQAGAPKIGTAAADYFEWRDLYSFCRELIGYPAYLLRMK